MESDDAERVLKADAMVERSGGFLGDCDSKETCKNALFSCLVVAEGWELSGRSERSLWMVLQLGDTLGGADDDVVASVGGGIVLSSVDVVSSSVWVNMSDFSTFGCFWVESTVMERDLSAGAVVELVTGSNMVADGVCEEKTEIFGEILLVE